MKNTVGERLSLLLKTIRMTEQQLAAKTNKAASIIYKIVNGTTENPSRTTIEIVAKATGSNFEWLMFGEGEMLSRIKIEANASEPWRDEAYKALKEEIEYLRDMLKMAMGKGNFQQALKKAALSKVIKMEGNVLRANAA